MSHPSPEVWQQPIAKQVELQRARGVKSDVPTIVTDIISWLESHQATVVPDIFRALGHATTVHAIKSEFEVGVWNPAAHPREELHSVCAVLKVYLRSLPDPVLPSKFYSLALRVVREVPDVAQQSYQLRVLVYTLPKPHRDTLLAIAAFLHKISLNAPQYHNMDARTLGQIFGPYILRPAPLSSIPSNGAQVIAIDLESVANVMRRFVDDAPFFNKAVPRPNLAQEQNTPANVSILKGKAVYAYAGGGKWLLKMDSGETPALWDVKNEDGWLKVELRGEFGYVPLTYVDVTPGPPPSDDPTFRFSMAVEYQAQDPILPPPLSASAAASPPSFKPASVPVSPVTSPPTTSKTASLPTSPVSVSKTASLPPQPATAQPKQQAAAPPIAIPTTAAANPAPQSPTHPPVTLQKSASYHSVTTTPSAPRRIDERFAGWGLGSLGSSRNHSVDAPLTHQQAAQYHAHNSAHLHESPVTSSPVLPPLSPSPELSQLPIAAPPALSPPPALSVPPLPFPRTSLTTSANQFGLLPRSSEVLLPSSPPVPISASGSTSAGSLLSPSLLLPQPSPSTSTSASPRGYFSASPRGHSSSVPPAVKSQLSNSANPLSPSSLSVAQANLSSSAPSLPLPSTSPPASVAFPSKSQRHPSVSAPPRPLIVPQLPDVEIVDRKSDEKGDSARGENGKSDRSTDTGRDGDRESMGRDREGLGRDKDRESIGRERRGNGNGDGDGEEEAGESESEDAISSDDSSRTSSIQSVSLSTPAAPPVPPALPTAADLNSNAPDPEKEKVQAKKRKERAEETLTTERTYVKHLTVLYDSIFEPLRRREKEGNPLLNSEEISNIFSNIEVIITCHRKLLDNFEQRLLIWDTKPELGDVFLVHGGFIKLYKHYVNNFDRSLLSFKQSREKYPEFQKFIQELEYTEKLSGLSVEAFLILPVQRIPRYVLLLQDLLKYTGPNHSDFNNLTEAILFIKDLADFINSNKSDADNSAKLQAIQDGISELPPGFRLEAADRRFIEEGTLLLKKKKAHLYLFSDAILVAKVKGKVKRYKALINLPTASVNTTDDAGVIKIISKEGTFKFTGETSKEREHWAKLIRSTLDASQTLLLTSAFGKTESNLSDKRFVKLKDEENAGKKRALMENLVADEAEYVESVSRTSRLFLVPLRKSLDSPMPMLPLSEFIDISSNLETLLSCHVTFLQSLKDRVASWDQSPYIYDLFNEKAQFLKLYNHYINHHHKSLVMIDQCMAKHPLFAYFLRDAERKDKCELKVLLAEPLRRVSKYYLMAQEMLQYIKVKTDEFEQMTKVVNRLKEQTEKLNNDLHESMTAKKDKDKKDKDKDKDKDKGEKKLDRSRSLRKISTKSDSK